MIDILFKLNLLYTLRNSPFYPAIFIFAAFVRSKLRNHFHHRHYPHTLEIIEHKNSLGLASLPLFAAALYKLLPQISPTLFLTAHTPHGSLSPFPYYLPFLLTERPPV